MEVHLYQVNVCESVLGFVHGERMPQMRVYIPDFGILAYRKDKIDWFSDNKELMEDAKDIIAGKSREGLYLESLKINDEKLNQMIEAGKRFDKDKAEFEKHAKSIIEIIDEYGEDEFI